MTDFCQQEPANLTDGTAAQHDKPTHEWRPLPGRDKAILAICVVDIWSYAPPAATPWPGGTQRYTLPDRIASMRTHGTLTKWNDDRGFGFVVLPSSGREVFVHVSAFPNDGARPRVGEMLAFDIARGADGRDRATNVARPGVRAPVRGKRDSNRSSRTLVAMTLALLAGGAAVASWDRISGLRSIRVPASEVAEPADTAGPHPGVERSFSCDGRTRCSQMTSCEEATYFLRHCPNTAMDGDGDGIPCERQWCN